MVLWWPPSCPARCVGTNLWRARNLLPYMLAATFTSRVWGGAQYRPQLECKLCCPALPRGSTRRPTGASLAAYSNNANAYDLFVRDLTVASKATTQPGV